MRQKPPQAPHSPLRLTDAIGSRAVSSPLLVIKTAGCSLCEGLEEKLRAVLDAASFRADSVLRGAALKLRQVDPATEPALAEQVPLLARRGPDGGEGALPRPQPRCTAAKLASQLETQLAAFTAAQEAPPDAPAAAPWEAVQGVAWQPRTGQQ